MEISGIITRIISNLYTVESGDEVYECRARGKFRLNDITPLVGDFVVVNKDEAYILKIKERKNSLSRPAISNVDVALLITSVKEPELSLNLLDKELLCIEAENIRPIIILTKCDLLAFKERLKLKKVFKYYRSIGYDVVTNKQISKIKKLIKGKTVVLTGQTGAGKSTLLNKLDKSLNLKTSPISKALGRGVHTTRHVELFKVAGAHIADTPGFSALDLNFEKEKLKNLFPEFKNSSCKYDDCNHVNEKGCTIKEKVERGLIKKSRYENYLKFRGEM